MDKLLKRAIFIAMSIGSLRADWVSNVNAWIVEGDPQESCQKIGRLGRTLEALPQSTKDTINDKCESVFLGVGRTKSEDLDWGSSKIHPRAWYAVQRIKQRTSGSDPEVAANVAAGARREFLMDVRKKSVQIKYGPTGRASSRANQDIIAAAQERIRKS